MRPIKFRGRYVKDYVGNEYIAEGEMIFGGFAMINGKPHIIPHDLALEVEPDSVAQLVGYDKNGNEVYEGDTVIAADRHEWLALFDCSVLSDEGFKHNIPLEVFSLKENNQS